MIDLSEVSYGEILDCIVDASLGRLSPYFQEYENLILISKAVHVIIHATSEITIREYLNPLQLDDSKLAKLNKLRTMAEMPVIIL